MNLSTQILLSLGVGVLAGLITNWASNRDDSQVPVLRVLAASLFAGGLVFAAVFAHSCTDDVDARIGPVPPASAGGGTNIGAPAGMVFVPGGSYDGERLGGFWLDVTEVTVTAYRKCVAESVCPPATSEHYPSSNYAPRPGRCNANRSDRDSHPVNCVAWTAASAYCRWRGARLPRSAEYSFAASNRGTTRFPWGSSSPGDRACWSVKPNKRPHTCPVRAFPPSELGFFGLAGGVWEWTATRASSKSGCPERYMHGGGSYGQTDERQLEAGFMSSSCASSRSGPIGFRCAKDE